MPQDQAQEQRKDHTILGTKITEGLWFNKSSNIEKTGYLTADCTIRYREQIKVWVFQHYSDRYWVKKGR